jgi:hypothetical protein
MHGKTPMLGATKHYQATSKPAWMPRAPSARSFMRPDPIVDFAMNVVRIGSEQGAMPGVDIDGIERAVKAMGLRDLGSVGTSNYVDGKSVTRQFSSNGAGARHRRRQDDRHGVPQVGAEGRGRLQRRHHGRDVFLRHAGAWPAGLRRRVRASR